VETRAAFAREATARRRLHNAVQELRGNIRVFVRVRPDGGAAGGVLHAEDGHRVLATTAGATKARRPASSAFGDGLVLQKARPGGQRAARSGWLGLRRPPAPASLRSVRP